MPRSSSSPGASATAVASDPPSPREPAGDEVVIVVDVRDPRTGAPAVATNVQGERVEAAVREAHDMVAAHGGRVIALLGTRLVASFPDAAVAAAIDAAVQLQQRAGAPSSPWACAVALATGPANPQMDTASLGIALVGGAVDRALLLASWTAAGAVVADDRTILTTQRHADTPQVEPGPRSWSVGTSHVLVGHEREPIEYWELSFPAATAKGASGTAASDATASPARRPAARPPAPTRADVRERLDALESAAPVSRGGPRRARDGAAPISAPPAVPPVAAPKTRTARAWSRGEVRCWFPNRGRGVIGSTTTQEFYVDRRFLAVPAPIDTGDRVYFVPRDAIGGGRNPAASAVLVVGAQIEVRVDEVDDRGFGVCVLQDPAGTRARLLLDLRSPATAGVVAGDWLLITIRAGEQGPVGEPV